MNESKTDGARLKAQSCMVAALRRAEAYPHPVGEIELFETHISWVLLAGDFAYKIKKAVDTGFLDYRSLASRRFYCEEELRLNRRGAPALYLGVSVIDGTPRQPRVDGKGAPIEFAVRMARFDQRSLLANLLLRGEPEASLADRLATRVARFHQSLPVLSATSPHGSAEETRRESALLADTLAPMIPDAELPAWKRIHCWIESQGLELESEFHRRKQLGMVRECHGDLHCGNVVVRESSIELFDGIEFSEALRSIDIINDLAFLVMDLQARGHEGIARQCLNHYLEITGDYAALGVLRYYLCYRALVRCMVELLRVRQKGAAETLPQAQRYLALADRIASAKEGAIVLTHGFSGCGKSTLAAALCRCSGAVRMRSDVERGRLFAAAEAERKYSAEATREVYGHLATQAGAMATAGWTVVVDATFLRRSQRERFRLLAERLGQPFAVIDFVAPPALLRERVQSRAEAGDDASEADVAVLERQLSGDDPFSAQEQEYVIRYDATRELAVAEDPQTWAQLAALLDRQRGKRLKSKDPRLAGP